MALHTLFILQELHLDFLPLLFQSKLMNSINVRHYIDLGCISFGPANMRILLNRMLIWSCEDHLWIIILEMSKHKHCSEQWSHSQSPYTTPQLNMGVAAILQYFNMRKLDKRKLNIQKTWTERFIQIEKRFCSESLALSHYNFCLVWLIM